MPAAARITDTTVHGGVVTSGFPTVLIGSKPASRITDMHNCPMFTLAVPHVGGPIFMGAFTVLTGNFPQSRQTDMALCVGPPDMIVSGQVNVMVGMVGCGGLGGLIAGLRMALLSLIRTPYPRAVLQEDGSIVTEYNESITIHGSPEYQAAVTQDLDAFLASRTGQRWQERYSRTGRHITIRPIRDLGPDRDHNNGYATRVQGDDALLGADGTPGSGSDTVIYFNPARNGRYRGEDGQMYDRNPRDTLGHELTHGLHNAEGTNRRNFPDAMDPGDNQEEASTLGVHGFEGEEVSERNLLAEDGRSARPDHDSIEEGTYRDSDGVWRREYTDEHGTTHVEETDPPADIGWRPNH